MNFRKTAALFAITGVLTFSVAGVLTSSIIDELNAPDGALSLSGLVSAPKSAVSAPEGTVSLPASELPIIIAEGPIHGIFVPLVGDAIWRRVDEFGVVELTEVQEEPRPIWRGVDIYGEFTGQFLQYINQWFLSDKEVHMLEIGGIEARVPEDGSHFESPAEEGETPYRTIIHHAKAPYFTTCRPTPGYLTGNENLRLGRYGSLMECVLEEGVEAHQFGAEGFVWDPEDDGNCVMYKDNVHWATATTESHKKWGCVIGLNPLPSEHRDSSTEVLGLTAPVSLQTCLAEVRSRYPDAAAASIPMESEDNNQCFAQFEITSTGRVPKDGGNELMAFTYANPTATETNESEEMQL